VQQRTLARDGSLNELGPAGAASRETGGAAGSSGGAAKRQALPEVTPKTMLSLQAYLGVEIATPWLTCARAQGMRTGARRAVEQT
jgi:hypothetical protein